MKPPLKTQKILPTSLLTGSIKIQSSRILILLNSLLHIAAVISILLTRFPLWLQSIVIVGLFIHFGILCHRWRRFPAYQFKLHQGEWCLSDPIAPSQHLNVDHCYYWSRYMVILQVSNVFDRSIYFPIMYDCCDADDFHRIRIITKSTLNSIKSNK
ncbi:MAG: protein YgfX [Cellvibrionaceae bacterium]